MLAPNKKFEVRYARAAVVVVSVGVVVGGVCVVVYVVGVVVVVSVGVVSIIN